MPSELQNLLSKILLADVYQIKNRAVPCKMEVCNLVAVNLRQVHRVSSDGLAMHMLRWITARHFFQHSEFFQMKNCLF